MVAATVHPAATATRGALRQLAAADSATRSVVVSTNVAPADADAVDGVVRTSLADALGPLAGEVRVSGRSESFGVLDAGGAPVADGPLVVLDFADGLRERTRVVAGDWPSTGAAGTPTAMLMASAAERLGVAPGDVLSLAGRRFKDLRVTVRIAGVLEPLDPADPAWAGDPLAIAGSQTVGSFVTVGPLFVDRSVLLGQGTGGRATLTWAVDPTFAAVPVERLDALAGGVATLPDRLSAALGTERPIKVRTGLPALLGAAARSLERAGSGSAAMAAPLVALAIVALLLVASLLSERRRGAAALLRARGAGSGFLLRVTLAEALLLAALAVAAGAPVGIAGVRLLDGGEGWGDGALPAIAGPAAVAVAVAGVGLAAVLALTLQELARTGAVVELRRLARRRRGSVAVIRSGFDLALLAAAGGLTWLLRFGPSAAAASAAGGGGRGLGPLEVVTPTALVLAGAVLTLRVTPWLGRGFAVLGSRALGLGGSVAGRSIARRGDGHAMEVMLASAAVATAVLATSLGATWAATQSARTAMELGADVTGAVGGLPGASRPGARAEYLAIPGVTAASPLLATAFDAGPKLRVGHLLAVPADLALAPSLTDGASGAELRAALGRLAAARPSLPLIALPEGTTRLRVHLADHLVAVLGPDGAEARAPVPTQPASVTVAVVIATSDGTLVRTDPVAAADAVAADGHAFDVAIPEAATAVVAIEAVLTPLTGAGIAGTIAFEGLDAAGADGATWQPMAMPDTTAWSFTHTGFGVSAVPLATAPDTAGTPATVAIPAEQPLVGPGPSVVAYRPAGLATLATSPLAALADATLPAATGLTTGDSIPVTVGLADARLLDIAGTIAAFPGIDGDGFAVVDLGTWQLAGYGAGGVVPAPTAWWLATDGRDDAAVVAALGDGTNPLAHVRSLAALTKERIADPVADAVLGTLGVTALAALLVALLALAAASQAAARALRLDVAILLAQGMERRAVAAWMLAEEAFPVAAGVILGMAVGAAVAELVTPALIPALAGSGDGNGVAALLPTGPALALVIAAALVVAGVALARWRALGVDRTAAVLRQGAAGGAS